MSTVHGERCPRPREAGPGPSGEGRAGYHNRFTVNGATRRRRPGGVPGDDRSGGTGAFTVNGSGPKPFTVNASSGALPRPPGQGAERLPYNGGVGGRHGTSGAGQGGEDAGTVHRERRARGQTRAGLRPGGRATRRTHSRCMVGPGPGCRAGGRRAAKRFTVNALRRPVHHECGVEHRTAARPVPDVRPTGRPRAARWCATHLVRQGRGPVGAASPRPARPPPVRWGRFARGPRDRLRGRGAAGDGAYKHSTSGGSKCGAGPRNGVLPRGIARRNADPSSFNPLRVVVSLERGVFCDASGVGCFGGVRLRGCDGPAIGCIVRDGVATMPIRGEVVTLVDLDRWLVVSGRWLSFKQMTHRFNWIPRLACSPAEVLHLPGPMEWFP